jgi:hypothetical protein
MYVSVSLPENRTDSRSSISSFSELLALSITLPSPLSCFVVRYRTQSLSPNRFGCDAIGCAAGSVQRRGGRQTSNHTACKACDVPSNVIGASVCQWYQPLPNQPLPRQKPALPSESITVSLAPTASPSSKARNDSVDGIVQPTFAQESPPAAKGIGIISGCLAASLCFVCLGVKVLYKARSRRQQMYIDTNGDHGERPTDDKKLDAGESSSNPEGADASVTSRSTQRFYLEGDNMAFEEKDNHHGRASILKTPMLGSTSDADISLNRMVRFRLPEPLPWSDSDEESVIKDCQQSPPVTGDAEAWVSWIMNPVFNSLSACTQLDYTPPVHREIDEELDRSPSTDSSSNSMSPILPRFENTSLDLDFGALETAPQVVSPEHEATMGIQDWHRGDDSDDAVFLEIGAVPATENGLSSKSSIVPQVSADDDDGLYLAGSEYGPGMYEI